MNVEFIEYVDENAASRAFYANEEAFDTTNESSILGMYSLFAKQRFMLDEMTQ